MEKFWNLVGSYLKFSNLNYAKFYSENKLLLAIFSFIGLVGLLLLVSQVHMQKDNLNPGEARKALENKGIDYNVNNLFEKASDGDVEIVKLFIISGMDINAKNIDGDTVLISLLRKDYKQVVNTNIVNYLLDRGADVNLQDNQGNTALMLVVGQRIIIHKSMIKSLLDKGADVSIKNNQGMTALILAACSGNIDINGHEDIVIILLDKGADVNAKDIYGMTALKCALDPSAVWLLDRSGKKELLDKVCDNLTNNAKDVVKTLCIRGAIYEKKSVQEMEKSEDEHKRIAEIAGKNKVSNFSDSDLKKMTKLILNTNGLLCADIVNIRSLKVRDNVYEVECIEYRSGQNRKTYIMDAAKGTAWNP